MSKYVPLLSSCIFFYGKSLFFHCFFQLLHITFRSERPQGLLKAFLESEVGTQTNRSIASFQYPKGSRGQNHENDALDSPISEVNLLSSKQSQYNLLELPHGRRNVETDDQ